MDEYDADHKSNAAAVSYWAGGNIWAIVSLFWVQVHTRAERDERAPQLPYSAASS